MKVRGKVTCCLSRSTTVVVKRACSASQKPRPSTACIRQGDSSPACSANSAIALRFAVVRVVNCGWHRGYGSDKVGGGAVGRRKSNWARGDCT